MASYDTNHKVRFGDIDHAGIVYYPRISHYCHLAFEDFFADRVGVPYHEIIDERRIGFPTVNSQIDFRETLAFGDVAMIRIDVVHLGRSSMTMRYRILKDGGKLCVEARITTVCIDMETFRPIGVPDDLRKVFAEHFAEE
jgi:4-hydroxybenzoyl-CoA thioesterase